MANLYFRYGAMGSSKTANALMVHYNYYEIGKEALLIKPGIDQRDGDFLIHSRMGLTNTCDIMENLQQKKDEEIRNYDCIIVDEAQFLTKNQVEFLVHIVDDLEVPVICYGLRTDFRHQLFEGSMWLMAWADKIEELKTVCWCGKSARCNARIYNGRVIYEGEQIMLGGNESYMALCRKHYHEGNTGKKVEKTD